MYRTFGKRSLDLVGSVLIFPIFVLVTLFVGPLIKRVDDGPIFFKGVRRGKNGKHFEVYKFRSMTNNAPDIRNDDGSTFNSDEDQRVTTIGRFLRKSSLDELPQIINVFKGDMSLVGPRPNMASKKWEELTQIEQERLQVRPGITGLAQVRYRNSATPMEKYLVDLEYINSISFIQDLKIMVGTVLAVVTSKNVNSTQERK